ncbi:cell wall lytic activity [Ornithinibacillus gellani]|uniref:C40 family peptidase n=1 Tax=Ornithinibacillus gellani TaxID=2293253 RepID=UPI000F475ACE|nr:NlpC/P60 family protein [Ornithinibacillus gellani]TQS74369.1 cell wall lytic activity [Ornithinibacillus gellani]
MQSATLEKVVKHSMVYSLIASQPFAIYVDANPNATRSLQQSEGLSFGAHGKTVRQLQYKLYQSSFYPDDVDGDFGVLTEHALKKLQQQYQLKTTGQMDAETIFILEKLENKRLLKKLKGLSTAIYPGMHADDVAVVQEALQHFGYYEGEIDGMYGPLTAKALKIAEEAHGIPLTNHAGHTLIAVSEAVQQEQQLQEQKMQAQQTETAMETVEKEVAQTQTTETKKVPVKAAAAQEANAVQHAKALIGTPYVWGGTSPSGFDCSGFIQYIFSGKRHTLPRTVHDLWNYSSPVAEPSVGDLVFFETYKPGPSHVGIYIGNGEFIHAGQSRGVTTAKLAESYWSNKYLGAARIP